MLKYIQTARKRLLQMHFETNTGHIGSNLSVLETLITLFHSVLKKEDRFILSKGHAAGALYISLWSIGLLSDEDLQTFCKDKSLLSGHPHPTQELIKKHAQLASLLSFPTGSLGHGPSLACGLAIAAKHQKSSRHIWCICGDGEWQEGSCWEALIFAVHHKLDNLTIMIDHNRLQGFGTVDEISSMSELLPKYTAFGAYTISVDGHNPEAICTALQLKKNGKPRVVILKTIKGKGLCNENHISSHYLPLTKEEYTRITKNLLPK